MEGLSSGSVAERVRNRNFRRFTRKEEEKRRGRGLHKCLLNEIFSVVTRTSDPHSHMQRTSHQYRTQHITTTAHQVRDLLLVESVDGFCWSLTRPPCCSTALGGPSEDVVCLKELSDEDRVLFEESSDVCLIWSVWWRRIRFDVCLTWSVSVAEDQI